MTRKERALREALTALLREATRDDFEPDPVAWGEAIMGARRALGVSPRRLSRCDDRKCPGWMHSHDSMGNGPGIERCDSCDRYQDDDAAAVAHERDCGCGMTVAVRSPDCPKCDGPMHRCNTGDEGCWHCDEPDCSGLIEPGDPTSANDRIVVEMLSRCPQPGDEP